MRPVEIAEDWTSILVVQDWGGNYSVGRWKLPLVGHHTAPDYLLTPSSPQGEKGESLMSLHQAG